MIKQLSKITKTAILCGIVFFLCLSILFALNIGNITRKTFSKIFPEYSITNKEFSLDKVELKDFILNEDGGIFSNTADPWIYIGFAANGIYRPFCIDIDVESASNIGEGVLIYSVDTYKSQGFPLNKGINHINLKNISRQDIGIRLDLTSNMHEEMHINEITFNNNNYLTNYFCQKAWNGVIWLGMIALTIFVGFLRQRISIPKLEKKVILSVIFLSYIVLFAFIIAGLWLFAFATLLLIFFITPAPESDMILCSCPKNYYILFFLVIYTILGAAFAYQLTLSTIYIADTLASKVIFTLLLMFLWLSVYHYTDICIDILVYIITHAYLQFMLNDYTKLYYLKYILFTPTAALNILFVIALVLMFHKLFGRNCGNFLFYTIFLAYIIANLIKMTFQKALFSLADFQLVGEIFGIAGQYIALWQIVFATICVVLLIILCIRFWKKLASYLKPRFSFQAVPMFLIVLIFSSSIMNNAFAEIGINVNNHYLINKTQINAMGFGFYTLLEFTGNQKTGEPIDYDGTIVADINKYKDNSTEDNSIKPTVILILAESLFEVENIPDISFNKELLSNLAPYKVTNTLSPSYGGRTAAAEFEALTGLSNLFIEGDVIPYTSYLNKTGRKTGSLAREFGENGYITYAIHANRANYYSRDITFENMGFDDFISLEDFALTEADYLNDGMVNDTAFVDQILQTLDNTSEPVFIFGASLEGHSPYSSKYSSADIVASSDKYDKATLSELSNFGQSVYNFDQQMGRLINYFETNDKPVLLYVFGDHIPPLSVNNQDGYLEDVWLKFRTPLYAYSNYCDTDITEEFISTSQIAPEILRKAGIEYRSYFDFIYQIRKSFPVTHKNVINSLENEQLQLYNKIQWDLLFGKRYLLQ